jgi:hypothetical protein
MSKLYLCGEIYPDSSTWRLESVWEKGADPSDPFYSAYTSGLSWADSQSGLVYLE